MEVTSWAIDYRHSDRVLASGFFRIQQAVVMIGGLFVISGEIYYAGIPDMIGHKIPTPGRSQSRSSFVMSAEAQSRLS
jgi:hypothetical protein